MEKSLAEILAKNKPWRRPKRNGPPQSPRRRVWECALRKMREGLRLSIKDVATAVGMTQSGYCVIEHGTDPLLSTARTIATFFGKSVEELWPKKVEEKTC